MRVLFFNEGNLGSHVMGQGQLDAALRTGLARAPEVQARFAGLSPMGRWAGALASRPIPPLAAAGLDPTTLRWHLVQSLRARAALRAELARYSADVVLLHSHAVSFAIGSRVRGAPVALSVDASVRDWSMMAVRHPATPQAEAMIAPSRALERRALRRAPLVLAWTAWARAAVERDAPGARVVEHHPGIDLQRYRPARRRERRLPRVLFVGGRFAEKGGEDLLAALGGELGKTVELDLVTPVRITPRPGVRVHRLEPSDPALLDLQRQADLFCLPSHRDAAPWALLEAMACGTPVVASKVGGIPDMLDAGRCGTLVPHGDLASLRDALASLLADEPRRSALASAARARCEHRYDARLQLPRLIELLRRARCWPGRGAASWSVARS
jgi:glycosyltransferase involved in cell wall biosynthesis